MAPQLVVQDESGFPLRLTKFAVGTESIVYAVDDRPDFVVKLYKDVANVDVARLEAMVKRPPQVQLLAPGVPNIAWPRELAYVHRRPVGFVMPRVVSQRRLASYLDPEEKARLGVDDMVVYLLARNLAAVFHTVHAAHYVVGDVDARNFLVAEANSFVSAIDVDAYQVIDQGKVYPARPSEAGIRAPETDPAKRKQEEDRFALGVLIYRLLRNGVHPFDGVPTDPSQVADAETYARNGWFPHPYPPRDYSGSSHLIPRPRTLTLSGLPPSLQDLAFRCFVEGAGDPALRPPAREWFDRITELVKAS